MKEEKNLNRQRQSLQLHLQKLLEGPMVFLGFVWLVLLVVELAWGLNPFLSKLSIFIWVIFIIDFFLNFSLAPQKLKFLKKNWLTVISLVIPALRAVRIVRVVRLLRGVRLVKIIASINRSMKSFSATLKRRGFQYVIAITITVIFAGAAGMYAFEKEGGLKSYVEALYWTAMLLTSIGSEYWPRSGEGKALCLLLSIYGFCVFGYITATLASFFIGRDAERDDAPVASTEELKLIQQKIDRLTEVIAAKLSSRD